MQLEDEINQFEEKWRNATHPEDKHYYFTIAAEQCRLNGLRLQKEGDTWATSKSK